MKLPVPIPIDLDWPIFLWITLKTILNSKRRHRESTRHIPFRFALEEVPDKRLTQAQKDYLKPIDEHMAALNYFPFGTFRITNLNFGKSLHRRNSNPTDPASGSLNIIEVRAKIGGVESVRNSWSFEFITRFPDGRRLSTRSKSLNSLF